MATMSVAAALASWALPNSSPSWSILTCSKSGCASCRRQRTDSKRRRRCLNVRLSAHRPSAPQVANDGLGLTPAVQSWVRERPESLRVFGRLPDTDARGCAEAGVRKASREETAGGVRTDAGVDYGEFAGAA